MSHTKGVSDCQTARRDVLIVFGICMLALSVRLSFLSSWASTPFFHSLLGDEQNFHNTALSLLGQRAKTGPFLYQPLYSFFLAALYWLFGVDSAFVRTCQLLMGVIGVYMAYLLGKRIGGVAVGRVNALLIALYGPLVFFEGHILAPGLVSFLLTVALLLLLKAGKSGHICFAFPAGLFMGLALMGRPNLGVLLPIVLLYFLVQKISWKSRIVRMGLAFMGLIMGLSPSAIYNLKHGGELVPVSTAGGISFFLGNNPQATGRYHVPKAQGIDASSHDAYSRSLLRIAQQNEDHLLSQSEVSDYWYNRGFDFWRRQPLKALKLFGMKLLMAFGSQEQPIHNPYEIGCDLSPVLRMLLTFGVLFPFFVLAVFWSMRTVDGGWMLVFGVAAYALSMAVFYVSDRYRLAMLPMLAPLAALGMVELGRRFHRGGIRVVWLGLLILLASFGLSQVTRASDSEMSRILSAGYNRLGTAAGTMGRLDEAEKAFEHAISLAGPRAGVGLRMNLGMTYFRKGDFQRAAKCFEDAANKAPDKVQPRIKRAQSAENLGELSDAIYWWKEAAKLMKDPSPVTGRIEELTRLMKNKNKVEGR